MGVLIDNQQERHPIAINLIQRKAQAILNALGCPDGELSVVLVDDLRITELNETYLQHRGPTNVISFPMREGDFGDVNPHLLGDVVISMDTCARESRDADIDMETRLDQLLIHGILHLFGYDHIHCDDQAAVMEAKSREMAALVTSIE